MKKTYVLFALILLSFSSCVEKKGVQKFDLGTSEKGTYSNDYFQFEFNYPVEWVIQSEDYLKSLMDYGTNLAAGDDENFKRTLEASVVNTANLFGAFEYEIGSPVDYNSSIMVIAENLKLSPGIKTGEDYLFQARKIIQQSSFQYDHVDEESVRKSIDGQEFYTMDIYTKYLGVDINQTYFSSIINGFALNFVISYSTDEQKQVLMNCIHSINFK